MSRYLVGTHHPQHALPPRAMWVAVRDGSLVGYVAGHLTRRYACDGELQWLYVTAADRRSGIASALFGLLAGWFAEHGARRVCVNVDDPAAREFYRSRGADELHEHWMVWSDVARAAPPSAAEFTGP